MQSSLLVVLVTVATMEVVRCQSVTNGTSMSVAFMNITTDQIETGFYQIYCVANNDVRMRIEQSTASILNTFDLVSSTRYFFNGTYPYTLDLVAQTTAGTNSYFDGLGVLISASSVTLNCFGVKSDMGTTDGFMALPITTTSTEFFIASWQCVSEYSEFFSGFQIISYIEDTCVNVFKIINGVYQQPYTKYFTSVNQVLLYIADCSQVDADVTGYYVNSSRPISVIAGQSCAFIPNADTNFCDYIAEQIPPVSELGTDHVVPPIIGRNTDAGYIVRVVATASTTISWSSPDGTTSAGSVTLMAGQFQQIDMPVTNQPLRVQCTVKCLVMQYNKGYSASVNDVPTDPMMMNVAANNHFASTACFATANFDADRGYTVDFNNFVSIVTTGDTTSILFDGGSIPSSWTTTSWGYSYTAFSISHGAHCITVKPLSNVLFGAYCYGHSVLDWSTSAYGYTVAYTVFGQLAVEQWRVAEAVLANTATQSLNATCNQEMVYSGSAVAKYPTSDNPLTVTFPISLDATVSTPLMSSTCRDLYKAALLSNLVQVSRQINFLICNKTMCPSLAGSPGTGVPLNQSQVLFDQVVFAAIDTSALSSAVQFDVDSEGAITAIHLTIPYIGIFDTTSDSFTQCRAEIRNFLIPFINWPFGNDLLPAISGCPTLTTEPPYQFVPGTYPCSFA